MAAAPADAQHPLATLPLDDPAYTQLGGLERQGCSEARVSAYRPFSVATVRRALGDAARDSACRGLVLTALRSRFDAAYVPPDTASDRPAFDWGAAITLRATALNRGEFRPLWRDVRPTTQGDPRNVVIARARGSWDGGPRLFATAELLAQNERRNDPLVRQGTLRHTGAVLDADEAYIVGQLGPLVVSFGRTREAWLGDSTESLALSAHGPPLDRLALSASWRSVEGRALYGMVDDVTLVPTTDSFAGATSILFHRFVAAHGLTWRPVRAVELSLGETMLISRQGGSGIDLAFANPLMPFVVTQNDSSRSATAPRDNLQVFAGLGFRPGGLTLAAEVLIDDIQIDATDRTRTPDQLGWRIDGALPVSASVPTTIQAQFQHVNSYTYVRRFYNEAHQSYGHPLGSELGPDADRWRLGVESWLDGRVRVSGGVGRWRHGAIRIGDRPGHDLNGHAGEPFPSVSGTRPAVQTAVLVDFALEMLDFPLPIAARVEFANISNVNNQPSPPALYARGQLVATYALRY